MFYNKPLLAAWIFFAIIPALRAQDQPQIFIRPRAGEEIILAVADVQPASPEQVADLAGAIKTFNQVLWEDLSFSGFFTLAGKSFYPPQPVVRPEDLNYDAWSTTG